MREKETINEPTRQRSIQDYFSLGYLYLLILGIIKDALFYGYLGVNIINYSSIQDILLSPIIHLTSSIKQFLVIFIGIPLIALLAGFLAKKYHNFNKNKEWYKSKKDYEKWDKIYNERDNNISFLVALMLCTLFGAFIGAGIGNGQKKSDLLKTQKLEMNHQITFTDEKSLKVNLLGHNSEYLFYATEKDTVVTIMPIQGNIKTIKNLD